MSTPKNQYPAPIAADWQGWQWPVRAWGDRPAVISHEFEAGERYKPGPDGHPVLNYAVHLGLDIMFQWRQGDPTGPLDTVALNPSHTRGFIAPIGTPIHAAGPGTIWSSGVTALGHFVQIDHGDVGAAGGVNTFYQHMTELAKPWEKGDAVAVGDVLGVMGGDPNNVPHLRHLHFELWFPRRGIMQAEWPTDPEPYMRLWGRL